jgi:nitrogen regulatory protein PII
MSGSFADKVPMKLLILFLNREELLEDILSYFVELGITGATIIESVGMGRVLTYDIPIFAGFRDLMAGSRPYNKTIFTVVNESLLAETIKGIQKICEENEGPGTGLLITLPVEEMVKLGSEAPAEPRLF